jgi:hypothetical protein
MGSSREPAVDSVRSQIAATRHGWLDAVIDDGTGQWVAYCGGYA